MASKSIWSTPVVSNTSDKREELGAVRKEWNSSDSCFKSYKYVKASLTTNATAGIPLAWYDTLGTVVTDDISTTSANLPAGVTIGALTHTYYGWVQVGGYCSSIKTSGTDDIADGDGLALSNSTDGVVSRVASGTANSVKLIGIAVTDDVDADNKVTALLTCSYGDIVQ